MAKQLSLSALAGVLAVALYACGGAGAATTAGTTAATSAAAPSDSPTTIGDNGGRQLTGAQQQALQAYRDCMKQNGVDLPAAGGFGGGFGRGQGGGGPATSAGTPPDSARPPRTLPPGVDQATYDKAQAACQSKLPAGGFGGGQGRGGPAYQAYLSCLRDNGVPVPTTQTGVSSPPPSIDRNDLAFASADAKCRVLLPNNGSTSSTSSSSTSTSQG
jgi:hypothetical protein